MHTKEECCLQKHKIIIINIVDEKCRDLQDSAQCQEWAERGECSANHDWMIQHCAKSCDHCEKPDEFGKWLIDVTRACWSRYVYICYVRALMLLVIQHTNACRMTYEYKLSECTCRVGISVLGSEDTTMVASDKLLMATVCIVYPGLCLTTLIEEILN